MINPEMVGQAQIATFALAQQVAQSASDWSFTQFFGHNPHPPTTGMLAIFAALSACDQVNAFGLTVNLSAERARQGVAARLRQVLRGKAALWEALHDANRILWQGGCARLHFESSRLLCGFNASAACALALSSFHPAQVSTTTGQCRREPSRG